MEKMVVKKAEKMTNRVSKKIIMIALLCLFAVPTIGYLIVQSWESNLIVDLGNVENAAVSLNGDSLSENSIVTLHVDFNRFYDYCGYEVECSADKRIARVELYQDFSFAHPSKELFIEIPLTGLSNYDDINEIHLHHSKKKQSKTIYLKNEL